MILSAWIFIWTDMNLLYILPNLIEIVLKNCFWTRFFKAVISILEKGVAIYLNKLGSPSPEDVYCQRFVIDSCIWDKNLKNVTSFMY